MSLRTYTIELRVDFDSKDKEEIMLASARQSAKQLFTTASLIADNRKPDIALTCGDLFLGAQEIDLTTDDVE